MIAVTAPAMRQITQPSRIPADVSSQPPGCGVASGRTSCPTCGVHQGYRAPNGEGEDVYAQHPCWVLYTVTSLLCRLRIPSLTAHRGHQQLVWSDLRYRCRPLEVFPTVEFMAIHS